MSKKAIVLLAEGFEEVEALTPVDYLRRAGVEVTVASISGDMIVKGARNIKIKTDIILADLSWQPDSFDAVIIPGGMPGATYLAASKEVGTFIKKMADTDKLICAICASPAVVLAPLGLLAGKNFTCYPGMEKTVTAANWSEDRVVVDGNIITSRGAGTAGEFAIAIINKLIDETAGKKIADSVLL
jgi:4-methyl-5(b-hydroxyethyl)-thiazole monophosphate biosynthesis